MTITCLIDDDDNDDDDDDDVDSDDDKYNHDDDDNDDCAGLSGDDHFCAHVPGNVAAPIIKQTNS